MGTPFAERALLWKDNDVMTKAKTNLSTEDWLRFIADVGVYREGGTVAHTTAKVADDKIREKFADLVADAVANGKSVQGQVVVLEGEDWFKAYYHEFPNEAPRGGPTDEEPKTNAFTTTRPPKDVIVLNKNKGNAGTTIHEGMHLYQHDDCLTLGSPFQEGLTEYLTRELTTPMSIPRTNYHSNYTTVVPVVAAAGEDVVRKAYFKGDVAGLRAALITYWKGRGADDAGAANKWTALLRAFNEKRWSDAKGLVT
jgi:hypothetical protein